MGVFRRRALVTVVAAMAWLGAAAGLGSVGVDSGAAFRSVTLAGVAPAVPALTLVNREGGDEGKPLVLVVLAGLVVLGIADALVAARARGAGARSSAGGPAVRLRGPPRRRLGEECADPAVSGS